MNHVLKGSSRTDLLCIPAIMLGFHPQDSCVVIALKGAAVAMCARVDLRWFAGDAERTLRQLNNALGNVPEARIVLVGFGDPDDASISVAELADALGWDRIADALISQGDRYWVVPATGAPSRSRSTDLRWRRRPCSKESGSTPPGPRRCCR